MWLYYFRVKFNDNIGKILYQTLFKRSMADHNNLRGRLDSTNSYRQLTSLRGEILRSKGQLPFSIYADILNRADEKIRTFEYPMCATAKITIVFSNGLNTEMKTEECLSALADDSTLSRYIFTRYPSASDYKMDMIDLTGTKQPNLTEPKQEVKVPEKNPFESVQPPPIQKIEEDVKNLSTRVDQLEKTFNEELPKINKKMNELDVKMDYLYFHLVKKDKDSKKDSEGN